MPEVTASNHGSKVGHSEAEGGLIPRCWMRLLFVGVLIYGLLRAETWARWLAVAYGLVMGAAIERDPA